MKRSEAMSLVTQQTKNFLADKSPTMTRTLDFFESLGLFELGLQAHHVSDELSPSILLFTHDDESAMNSSIASIDIDDDSLSLSSYKGEAGKLLEKYGLEYDSEAFFKDLWQHFSPKMDAEMFLRHLSVVESKIAQNSISVTNMMPKMVNIDDPQYLNFLRKTMDASPLRVRLLILIVQEADDISWENIDMFQDAPLEWLITLL